MGIIKTGSAGHPWVSMGHWFQKPLCVPESMDVQVPLVCPSYLWIQGLTVQVSCSVVSSSFRPHGLQHARPLCPSPTPGVYPNSCPLSSDAIQQSHPLSSPSLLPSIFTTIRVFSKVSQFFATGGQSIGASVSASVLPINIQG